jgi:hypothetical protein
MQNSTAKLSVTFTGLSTTGVNIRRCPLQVWRSQFDTLVSGSLLLSLSVMVCHALLTNQSGSDIVNRLALLLYLLLGYYVSGRQATARPTTGQTPPPPSHASHRINTNVKKFRFKTVLNLEGFLSCWPGSSVSIVTGYGLYGPGIESRWGARLSAPVQTGPGAHPASCTMGTGSFPGVESGRGVTLTLHPLLLPRSKNRVELYLYSP